MRFTTANDIKFTLASLLTSVFPTSILPIVTGNMNTLGSTFFWGRVYWMIS